VPLYSAGMDGACLSIDSQPSLVLFVRPLSTATGGSGRVTDLRGVL
jgi:hypothetical protein